MSDPHDLWDDPRVFINPKRVVTLISWWMQDQCKDLGTNFMHDIGKRWWFLMFGITHLIPVKKTLHWKTHAEASPSAAVLRCLVLNAWAQCIKITQLNAWAWNSVETDFWDCLLDTDSLSLGLSPGIWIPIKFSQWFWRIVKFRYQ